MTFDDIVEMLSRHQQRATYGAVAGLVGRLPRSLMTGLPKCWEYSWVVSASTGMPTGYDADDIDPALEANPEVINTPEWLAEWMVDHS